MMKKLSWLLVFVLVLSVGCFAARKVAAVKAAPEKEVAACQALVKIGTNLEVPAEEKIESAVAVAGSVVINGEVQEDVVAFGGSVTLKDGAEVGGTVVAIGGQVIKEPGAISKGQIVEVNMPMLIPIIGFLSMGNFFMASLILSVLITVGFVVLAALFVAFFTPQIGKTSAFIEKKFWPALGWGILTPILCVLLAIALCLSIIGIVLIPLEILLFVAAGVFGYIAAAQLCGKKLLTAMRLRNKPMLTEVIVGLVLLWFVNMIPIIGGIINAILWIAGLGAVAVTKFGTK